MNVQDILVFDDSETVVKQVKKQIHCISSHLKHYEQLSHSFNIVSISRMQNYSVDLLARVASRLIPA